MLEEELTADTSPVKAADLPRGAVEDGIAAAYTYQTTSIAAIQATNALLARGVALRRTTATFMDSGRTFGAGAVILPPDRSLAEELAGEWGLVVSALSDPPEDSVVGMSSLLTTTMINSPKVRPLLLLLSFLLLSLLLSLLCVLLL